MKYVLTLLFVSSGVFAQAIYDANGQYKGYVQTAPSGVTTTYNAQGQSTGTFQTDNGQTSFYNAQGQYQGTSTVPITPPPNTTINTPRMAPQAPMTKGW